MRRRRDGTMPIRPKGLVYLIRNPKKGLRPTIIDGVDMRKLFYHRVSAKCGSDFSLNQTDFEKFIAIMGPVPKGMVKPNVGRLDHSKGYVYDHERRRWNFEWQSKADNAREDAMHRWHKTRED